MKSSKLLLFLLAFCTAGFVFAQPGYYPSPASVIFHNDTLTICPPDSLPGPPVLLLGYNVYVDSVFFDNITGINSADTIDYIFEITDLLPGSREFCVKALYNDWISDAACDTGLVMYGVELPFLEDWSSGGFEENLWSSSSGNWVVTDEVGNPAPAATFRGEPGLVNYEAILESYPITAIGMTIGRIWLDFDIKLDAVQWSNSEQFFVQIWNNSNHTWTTVEEFSAWHGSFDLEPKHISINAYAMNKTFMIRFVTKGMDSGDIIAWQIDNIHIYRKCDGPSNLELDEYTDHNELNWESPSGCDPYWWIHWDDGVNANNSIGTGGPAEFDVAARWTPDQLSQYAGYPISQIAFFPAESAAEYRARIWIGEGPDTLIFDEPIISPNINHWNYYTLPNPVQIDVTQELWVGYNIVTPTGYPAGVDDGPEIDGYGNMIYFNDIWSTLTEINSELQFNWNIACRLGPHEDDPLGYYNIYRQTNNDGFILLESTVDWSYSDYNIDLSDYYCYKVTIQWYTTNGDSCETNPSNTACEYLMLGTGPEQEKVHNIRIYPNPANKLLTVESDETIREIRMYSPLGETVLKLEIGNLKGTIDVSGLKNGIYFVEVVTENHDSKEKILIFR